MNCNPWSNGKTKKIEVLDFFFNMRDVQWKGKVLTVEYDLFMGLVQQMMKGNLVAPPMTKEEALDEIFEMTYPQE